MHSLFLTDLDGTLLQSDRTIGPRTLDALEALGQRGVVRVVATGRSLHSARRVLDRELPIDYLIFSSGTGLIAWGMESLEELLLAHTMQPSDMERAVRYLVAEEMDVMIHRPPPNSHCFGWLAAGNGGEDLRTRVDSHDEYSWPLAKSGASVRPHDASSGEIDWSGPASMVLGVMDAEDHELVVERARSALPGLQVIRTTSPINGRSLWLEVVPKEVSKASAAEWLADSLEIAHERTFAVGNDYNDEALLAWASASAVVASAPAALRARFCDVKSNDEDGVVDAIERFGL